MPPELTFEATEFVPVTSVVRPGTVFGLSQRHDGTKEGIALDYGISGFAKPPSGPTPFQRRLRPVGLRAGR